MNNCIGQETLTRTMEGVKTPDIAFPAYYKDIESFTR